MTTFAKKLILLTFLTLFISCTQKPEIKSGKYIAKDNRIFYEIDFDNQNKSVKIYIASGISQKKSNLGNFKIEDTNLILENVESDILPSARKKEIYGEILADVIIISCPDLSNYFFGQKRGCKSENIEFVYQKP